MCVTELNTYIHADGRQEVVETTYRCRRATESSLCGRTERRNGEQIRVIERRPGLERPSTDAYLVTGGRDGRERYYRDVSRRSSTRSSYNHQRGGITSESKATRSPSFVPSPSTSRFEDIKLPSRSPQSATASELIGLERKRRPWVGLNTALKPAVSSQQPSSPDTACSSVPPLERAHRPWSGLSDVRRSVAPSGTATYDHAPSLELPRARDNERRTHLADPMTAQRPPISSPTSAPEAEDTTGTDRRYPRGPSVRINIPDKLPMGPSTRASPLGPSPLPRFDHVRNDSATDLPKYHLHNSVHEQDAEDRHQAQLERNKLAESERRQEARIERDRIAQSERRQQDRIAAQNAKKIARDASKDRHRREAMAALEGKRLADTREQKLQAEIAQLLKEKAAVDDRNRRQEAEQARRDVEKEERRRDASHRRQHHATQISTNSSPSQYETVETRYSPRGTTPLHLRSTPRNSESKVTVRQYRYPSTSSSGLGSSFSALGANIIAREQAHVRRSNPVTEPSSHLSGTLGGMDLRDLEYDDGLDDEVEYETERFYIREGLQRRESRNARRDDVRADRKREDWRRDDGFF